MEMTKCPVKCADLARVNLSKPQPYLASKCLSEARMGFRIQTRMIVCPGNMKGKFCGRSDCQACLAWRLQEGVEGVEATQDHLKKCPTYSRLRVGRDIEYSFTDLIKYFMDVMLVNTNN